MERSNNYFSSYRVNKNFLCRDGLNVCMNYEFNLLHHVGVLAKRVRAAAAAETETAAHEGDDNTPSGPTGRGVKIV